MSMRKRLLTYCVCLFIAGASCTVTIQERFYHREQSTTGATPFQLTNARSKLECAVRCKEDDSCTTFSFNGTNRACFHSKMGLPEPHMVYSIVQEVVNMTPVSSAHCSVDYVDVPGTTTKYKYHSVGTTHANAENQCSSDGGSLFTIMNAAEMNFLLSEADKGCIGTFVWITGDKKYEGWTEWGADKPKNNECFILCNNHDGMEGRACTTTYPFICRKGGSSTGRG